MVISTPLPRIYFSPFVSMTRMSATWRRMEWYVLKRFRNQGQHLNPLVPPLILLLNSLQTFRSGFWWLPQTPRNMCDSIVMFETNWLKHGMKAWSGGNIQPWAIDRKLLLPSSGLPPPPHNDSLSIFLSFLCFRLGYEYISLTSSEKYLRFCFIDKMYISVIT